MSSSHRAPDAGDMVAEVAAATGADIGIASREGAANASSCDGADEACISQPNHGPQAGSVRLGRRHLEESHDQRSVDLFYARVRWPDVDCNIVTCRWSGVSDLSRRRGGARPQGRGTAGRGAEV